MNTKPDPRFIDGKAVQARILEQVAGEIAAHHLEGTFGRLVSISIGDVEEVAVYIRNQKRVAEKVGIPFDDQYWAGDLTQEDCKARISAMNDDPDVLGIILQRPVPGHINVRSLQSAIHPLKDVEGMNPASIGNIVYNDTALAPCTAAAAVELIRETGLEARGTGSRHDRPFGDCRQTGGLHADGRRRDSYHLPSHDPFGCSPFKAG